MASASDVKGQRIRMLGLITAIIGVLFIVAGGVTWGMVSTKLAAENITVSPDAPMLAGAKVAGPPGSLRPSGRDQRSRVEGDRRQDLRRTGP